MNFYAVEFQNGFIKEIKTINDDIALKSTQSLIRRWNQPSGIVYRTNPYNPQQKRNLGIVTNPEYNPNEPSLTEDPRHLMIREPQPAEKKRKKVKKAATKNRGRRSTFKVPLSAIAEKMGTDAAVLRRKLRKSNITKPDGGWGWNSWDDPAVKEILTWK